MKIIFILFMISQFIFDIILIINILSIKMEQDILHSRLWKHGDTLFYIKQRITLIVRSLNIKDERSIKDLWT